MIVGVDGSGPSLHAVKWAVELASDLEVEAVAVHASPAPVDGSGDRVLDLGNLAGVDLDRGDGARPHRAGGGWCSDWTDALHGNAVYRAIVSTRPAATALVEVCRDENAHCLVIGTRHSFEHSHHGALFGELRLRVACPLLVVPLGEPTRLDLEAATGIPGDAPGSRRTDCGAPDTGATARQRRSQWVRSRPRH